MDDAVKQYSLSDEELRELYPDLDIEVVKLGGPIAAREYASSLEAFHERLRADMTQLVEMEDAAFVDRAAFLIFDAANMNRFNGMEHVHAMASAAYHESQRRFLIRDHHQYDCRKTSLYQLAYNNAVRDAGHSHMARAVESCSCGRGKQ